MIIKTDWILKNCPKKRKKSIPNSIMFIIENVKLKWFDLNQEPNISIQIIVKYEWNSSEYSK